MIAGCPKCSARYRVDLEQIGEDGAKLRCTKCSAVFLVRAPQSPPVAAPTEKAAPQTGAADAPGKRTPAPSPPSSTADVDRSRLVLVADPSEERGKGTAQAIESWGLTPVLVHDGVEAMLSIQRMLPTAVVLDAALPKMFGFQVCEVVKRNESLRHLRVVLVGAIHHQDRYRRDPSDLYGADVYLEQPDLPDGLLPLLRDAGMPVKDEAAAGPAPPQAPPTPPRVAGPPSAIPSPADEAPLEFATPPPQAPRVEAPASAASAPPAPSSTSNAPASATPASPTSAPVSAGAESPAAAPATDADPEVAAERERAERLARIAVSEMVLYQPEKFDQAIRDDNIEAVLDLEIQEARALIRQRISDEVRAEKDFILVELERVARERGAAH